jgi:fermentation-respiration switch protein FrsA (DUF1100 family)
MQVVRRFFAAFALLAAAGCGSLFFYPKTELRPNLTAALLSPEDVAFESSDHVRLHGWFFSVKEPRGTVLVLHGNAENLSTHVNSVLWMVLEGFNVFIIDYRGYGRSEGSPSIAGVHRDAEAALAEVLRLPGVDPDRVAVLGQSIGGAIAVYTVANSPERKHVRALVIDSAFSSYRRIAREKLGDFFLTWPLQYPLSFLVGDRYSPERWIAKISPIPLLILHGREDPVVPIRHGLLLYASAREPKTFLETEPPGHVQSFADPHARNAVVSFLDTAFSSSRTVRTAQASPAFAMK